MVNQTDAVLSEASLSTMWAIGRYTSMADFVTAARRLGFGQVEANYQLTLPMISEIMELRNRGEVVISSVHDPATLPPGVALAQLPQLSSLDEGERSAALAMSRQAVDLAAGLGARVLVVHPGNIPGLRPIEARLRELYSAGQTGSTEYARLRQQLIDERSRRCEVHLQTVTESLRAIASYAAERGLRVGLENRYYYHEIPLVDEALRLLVGLSGYDVGYWHDTGHSHCLGVLGFVDEMEWLERLAPWLVGLHLHDAAGLRDHLAPGAGEIDFAKMLPYVASDAIRVCEVGSFNDEGQVGAGLRHLESIGYF